MRLFHLARHPTHAIHIALAVLLLAFGLNAIAHASHSHDSNSATNTSALHTTACGYCETFGAFADSPCTAPIALAEHNAISSAPDIGAANVFCRTATSANPRAPPRR